MREGYERRNILFTIWLFDNHRKCPNLLEPNLFDDLKTHDTMDKARTTKNGKQSKSRESIRKACRNALREIKPGVDQSITVKFDLLDFKVFLRFLSTFKKRVKRREHKGQEFNAIDGTIAREQEVEV